MKILFYLILTVFISGCSSTQKIMPVTAAKQAKGVPHWCDLPILVGISNNVPEEQRAVIKKAFSFWNEQSGIRLFFDMGIIPWAPDEPEAAAVIAVGYPRVKKFTTAYATSKMTYFQNSGCISKASINLYVDLSLLEERDAFNSVRHEFGHILGLRDKDTIDEVMSREIPRFYELSPTSPSNDDMDFIDKFYRKD